MLNAFRSEADVEAWCARNGVSRGAVIPMDQCFRLAEPWYRDRIRDWQPKTADVMERIFASVGLTGEFWRVR